MAATIKDVAKRAKVSLGTVSKYINGIKVKDVNKKRIEEAIEELDFNINIMAKGLKSNRSMTVAVVISHFYDFYSAAIISELERNMEKEGYSIITCSYDNDPSKLVDKLNYLKKRFIDAVIVFPFHYNKNFIEIIEQYISDQIPVIFIDHDVPEVATDKIVVDNLNASFRAVERFIHNNHRKIAIINGDKESYASIQRFLGYRDALKTYGIPLEDKYVKYGNFDYEGGYKAAKELMQSADRPTALYITNYCMTWGAVLAMHELDIRVPAEIFTYSRYKL
jgi:LacI family transcriptional regulator